MTCKHCGREVDPTRMVSGFCHACLSPEALQERLSRIPGPLGDVLRRVGEDLGIVDRP